MTRMLLLAVLLAAAVTQDLTALKGAAEQGDPRAQLEYGKALCEQARSDTPEREEAGRWVQKAADQGLAEAWFWLGYAGLGSEHPAFYYERAAEQGYPQALGYLLDHLLFRAGSSADVVKAKRFADLARELGIDLGYDSAAKLATIDRCFEAGRPETPPSDKPTDAEAASFRTVGNCLLIKEGVGRQPDVQKYRKCLMSQDPADNNSLAEVYANGWGVPRNPKLAIGLVCHASQVPAELIGLVDTLYTTKEQAKLPSDFLFCDHVTSTMGFGACASRAEEIATARREDAWATLLATWPDEHKAAVRKLRDAGETFFESHSMAEYAWDDRSLRVAQRIYEQARLQDELLETIRGFEAGKLPDVRSYEAADAELNAVYSQIMKREQPLPEWSPVTTTEGIRETQRHWIDYREAWAAFGGTRYPEVSPDGWRAWVTRDRAEQLNELLTEINSWE